MSLLGASDELPLTPRRVLVAGTSGSGKTTLSGRIGESLGLPHVELDSLFHGPGWQPRAEFADDVRALAARPRWVTEWQYHDARPVLAARADLLVWLDHPRATALRRLVWRTVRRRVAGTVLWNGNVEPPLYTVFTDREHVVRWAWNAHGRTRHHVDVLRASGGPAPVVVRLRGQREVDEWRSGPLRRVAGYGPDGRATPAER
ncbi:AAA family ATPase [Actinosynnema pretiosum subsp. pretiosum]|uniref:AAA family ATPase n=1 Tax=Actinosynnema pretiosum subsp. pretiosum TaxID=103721 RepID=A0AA45L5E5_9PSEU|nr:Adenylate kinase [Actinosynnema pretiosum subsp. pretiosum]QUF03193.1 AAA family ATPase [Actinosynnema pretiosum subsp. pretiosum]